MKELIEIQAKLKAPKNQFNKFGGYKYRNCEDILEAVKPLLHEAGCVLTISDAIELIGNRVYVKAVASLSNSEGQKSETVAFAREPESRKGMDEAQVTGASSSYARKYALNGLFCIDDSKDADSHEEPKIGTRIENKANTVVGTGQEAKIENKPISVNPEGRLKETTIVGVFIDEKLSKKGKPFWNIEEAETKRKFFTFSSTVREVLSSGSVWKVKYNDGQYGKCIEEAEVVYDS